MLLNTSRSPWKMGSECLRKNERDSSQIIGNVWLYLLLLKALIESEGKDWVLMVAHWLLGAKWVWREIETWIFFLKKPRLMNSFPMLSHFKSIGNVLNLHIVLNSNVMTLSIPRMKFFCRKQMASAVPSRNCQTEDINPVSFSSMMKIVDEASSYSDESERVLDQAPKLTPSMAHPAIQPPRSRPEQAA